MDAKKTLYQNHSQPKLKSGILSLEPETGQLGYDKAKHLINRCAYGARHSEIDFLKTYTAEEAIDFLLQPIVLPSPPLSAKEGDEEVPIGETWVTTKYNSKYRGKRIYSYLNWWLSQLLHPIQLSLSEKMVFFWHNHFVIESDVVRNVNYQYQYNSLLRSQALGNFKTLVEEVTISTGMLKYLNGNDNVNGAPNENYARELFELFTIGKGPLIEEGNYTNYTEHDIREAAKVLTGWKINSNEESWFNASKHDTTDKTFSTIYNNQVITNNNENEYKDLVNMIFQKKETARFIVRKLYRFFVYYQIDEEIEQDIIEPLADLFYDNNYDIKPVLKKLLSSQHFYDENLKGCMIKNPLEFSIGMFRQLEVETPDDSDIIAQYHFWNYINNSTRLQDLFLGGPPDVAGWPAYYLSPQFNEIWINSATIPQKAKLVNAVVAYGFKTSKMKERVQADPFTMAYLANDPSDINDLISTITGILFPMPATDGQIAIFKDILNQGLPDFEWRIEWRAYVNNPDDENQKNLIKNRLKNFIERVVSMAEYQLM